MTFLSLQIPSRGPSRRLWGTKAQGPWEGGCLVWSRPVHGYIGLSLALSQTNQGVRVSRLSPTKKGFSAVSRPGRWKPGASHSDGILRAQALVKFNTVSYEEAKGLLCRLLGSEAGMRGVLSEEGGAPLVQAAPSSVHEPHTEIRTWPKRVSSAFMPPTTLQILISQKLHFSTYNYPNYFSIFLNDQ